jgi:lipoprotein-anchoring transpeptidase ErfK/SrfK
VQPVTTSGEVFDQQEIEKLVAAGNEAAALKLLSQWYWKQPGQRGEIQQQLDRLAKAAYFSPQPNDCEPYVIQPGDQLRKVANKYQLTWQYLAKLNQVDPKKIRTGKKLKVVEGPFSAVVDLSDYELTIHCHGNFVRKYRVGTGKDGVSPIGEFVVKEKLENPTYYGPNGDVKAPDDPLNPLGERWIDIGDSFGIHGTIEPDSIGRSESRGCIRMLNSDVEDVYDLLTIGSPVRIQR